MTTVAQMIEWLKTQPQDAVIEILSHSKGSGYYDQGGWCTAKQFDPTEKPSWCREYSDYQYFSHWELSGGAEVGYELLIGEVE